VEKTNTFVDKLQQLINRLKQWYADWELSKTAKKANIYLLFLWRASLAFLVIWLIWKFNSVTESDTYALKAFSVTPDMERLGYRGETVVARIMSDMLAIIYTKDSSTSRVSACRQNDKARLKTQIRIADGTEAKTYDIKGIIEAGKTLFDREDKVISGYITQENRQTTLWIQMPDAPLKAISIGENTPLDSLFYRAALFLTRQTTPQYLASYLIQTKQFDEAERLIAELDFQQRNMPNATVEDGIQTLSNWANFYLAKGEFDRAFEKATELRQLFPNDIAGYALQVSILMSKAGYSRYGYGYDNIPAIDTLARQAFAIAQEAEDKENKLQSVYFNKQQVMGLMLCNAAYLANQCKLAEPRELEKRLQKSRAIMPQSVYIYNTLAYFYLKQDNPDSAKRYVTDALNANQVDGNICDSYAEVMLHFKDTAAFFHGIELALKYQRPATPTDVENYRNSPRWQGVRQSSRGKQFDELFDRYARLRAGK
jgi:tetratricopeptide (TPR) repeat protein